jgi:hypothetical protein
MATKAATPEPDNMRIWAAVEKTDPKHTKPVEFGRKFTAIDAHYQIREATRVFGPIGEGWGYTSDRPIFEDGLVIVPVTLWHGTRQNTFGPIYGSTTVRDRKGNVDKDAPKKATTDAVTKGLSQLGFNADVFLGKFDDNKYVADMEREFHPPANDQPAKRVKLDGPYTSKTALWTAVKAFDRDARGCGDMDMLEALMASKETVELFAQLERDAPQLLHGGDSLPDEYEPLLALVARLRIDFNAPTYLNAG